jgi:hypothetical protein
VRARRYLDQVLAEETEHPTAQVNYQNAIIRLDRDSRHEDAEFMRELARLEPMLCDTTRLWRDRYTARAVTSAEQHDRRSAVTADWTMRDDPYAGVDGALYTPGVCRFWSQDVPVVLAQSRGAIEFMTGFPSLEAARNWVRDDRCTADPRPLAPPPGILHPRITQEECALAGMLRYPEELSEFAEYLPAVTFTTDVRYEIFAAIYVSRHGPADSIAEAFGGPGIDQITQETLTRLARGPDWDNPLLGGPGTPLATAYLHRLATTPINADTARRAAHRLAVADAQALLNVQPSQAAGPRAAVASSAGDPAASSVVSAIVDLQDVRPRPSMPSQVPWPLPRP